MASLFSRAWKIFDALVVARIKSSASRLWASQTQAAARGLYAGAGAVARLPFRSEPIELPPPISVNGSAVDVVADLTEFTALPRATVERQLMNRSFRAEWQATSPELRDDHWYYLSAKGYLFANAIHFPDTEFVDEFVRPHVKQGGQVLDFGGGTGNLAIALAAAGYNVSVQELNALQRDFIRFRVTRHGLSRQITALDWWDTVRPESVDAVVAVDVLEHLADARSILDDTLLPALKPDGVLVENSPFVVNPANPMHHEDFGLEAHLRSQGLEPVVTAPDGTRVWRPR